MTRKVTAPAREGLRDPLSLVMLAAWVNVDPDKLPKEMQAPSCEHTMAAWKRVGEAAVAYIGSRQPTPAPAADAEVREAFERFVDTVDRLGRGNNAIHDAIIEARTALAASPKAPSVAIGAGEVERLLAFARGGPMKWRREGSGGASTDYNALRADILAALTPASASIPADVERVRKAVIDQLVEEGRAKHRVLNDEQQEAADDDARAFYRKVIDRFLAALAARPSTGEKAS